MLLLVRDLTGADPAKLQMAAYEWARTERFMPKACDLLGLMNRGGRGDPNSRENLERLAAKYNAAEWMRPGLRWTVEGGNLKLAAF